MEIYFHGFCVKKQYWICENRIKVVVAEATSHKEHPIKIHHKTFSHRMSPIFRLILMHLVPRLVVDAKIEIKEVKIGIKHVSLFVFYKQIFILFYYFLCHQINFLISNSSPYLNTIIFLNIFNWKSVLT